MPLNRIMKKRKIALMYPNNTVINLSSFDTLCVPCAEPPGVSKGEASGKLRTGFDKAFSPKPSRRVRTGPSTKLITSDLAGVVCQLSRMAITNDLPSVFRVPVQKFFGCWVSQMASRFTSGFINSPISSFIRTGLLFALLLACSWAGYAADFSLEDMQGKTHRLSDYRGKWVLVNFWATWCPPCLNEIPELISLYNAHQDKDLSVIGISMDSGSSKIVADFAKAHGISYPVVMGNRKITAQIGAVDVLPVSYLYNPKGEQVSYQAGEVTRASVEAYIKKK